MDGGRDLGVGGASGHPGRMDRAAERRENTKEQMALAFWRVMANLLYPWLDARQLRQPKGKIPKAYGTPCSRLYTLQVGLYFILIRALNESEAESTCH